MGCLSYSNTAASTGLVPEPISQAGLNLAHHHGMVGPIGMKAWLMVCRRYESVKGRREAELQAQEEEQQLIELLRAEDLAEASRLEAERRRHNSQELRRQMAAANQLQIQLKVYTPSCHCCTHCPCSFLPSSRLCA